MPSGCFTMASKIPDVATLGFLFWGYFKNLSRDVHQPQQPVTIRQLSATMVRECRMFQYKTRLKTWPTDAKNAKVLLKHSFLINK